MRTKNNLLDLHNISLLFQYLYMSKEHYFIYNNGLTDLKVYMDDDFYIWTINLRFPDTPPMRQEYSVNTWLAIIDKLKETKPIRPYFENAWEEIFKITEANMFLNLHNEY